MARGIAALRVGHTVIFKDDPLLYGGMLVVEIKREARKIKWIACLVDFPEPPLKRTEHFFPHELEMVEEVG